MRAHCCAIRLLRSVESLEIVKWRGDGFLVIFNTGRLEELVWKRHVCDHGVKYPSIARQLRVSSKSDYPVEVSGGRESMLEIDSNGFLALLPLRGDGGHQQIYGFNRQTKCRTTEALSLPKGAIVWKHENLVSLRTSFLR